MLFYVLWAAPTRVRRPPVAQMACDGGRRCAGADRCREAVVGCRLVGHNLGRDNMRFEHFSRNRRIMRALQRHRPRRGVRRGRRPNVQGHGGPPDAAADVHRRGGFSDRDAAQPASRERGRTGVASAAGRRTGLARRAQSTGGDTTQGPAGETAIHRCAARRRHRPAAVDAGREGAAGPCRQGRRNPVRALPGGGGERRRVEHRSAATAEGAARGHGPPRRPLHEAAAEVLGADAATARTLIGSLIASGVVRAEGNTRARRYRLTDKPAPGPRSGAGDSPSALRWGWPRSCRSGCSTARRCCRRPTGGWSGPCGLRGCPR